LLGPAATPIENAMVKHRHYFPAEMKKNISAGPGYYFVGSLSCANGTAGARGGDRFTNLSASSITSRRLSGSAI